MRALISILNFLSLGLLFLVTTSHGNDFFRGHLILGHEVRSFTPCEKGVEYWVLDHTGGDLKDVYQKLTHKAYQSIYVEVRGVLEPPPLDGFGADYDRQVTVHELRRAGLETRGCKEDLAHMIFRASGNEPFWNVAISESDIIFSELGKPKLTFPYANLEVSDNIQVFVSKIKHPAQHHIRISITEKRCIDTMSGEHFSFTAKVDLDDVEYLGCAREGWDRRGTKVLDYNKNVFSESRPALKILTLDVLKNAQYQSEFSATGRIKLFDGVYKEKLIPNSATELVVTLGDEIAFGDLNDDSEEDAATILITDSGGSGTFRHLVVVLNQMGSPKHVASRLLGDRVKVKSLSIKSGEIAVRMMIHGPDDPVCCPSLEATQNYILQDNDLVLVQTPELLNREWTLESFGTLSSEEKLLAGTEISIQFSADGRLHGSGGCNRYFAGYKIGPGDSLTIKQIGSTRMACPPEIMDQEMNYFKALQSVSAHKLDKQNLLLFYENREGILNFSLTPSKE